MALSLLRLPPHSTARRPTYGAASGVYPRVPDRPRAPCAPASFSARFPALLARVRSILDFTLRLAFFATAPFVLVFLAALFPLTGALVQIGLALGVFFTAEAARGLSARSRVARIVLGKFLRFEEYYRTHPPKPLAYYVFYPLLFPYWLIVPAARREFLIFKGYTIASFVVLVGGLVAQYLLAFAPDLGLREFAPIAIGTFLVESVVVLAFLMPIVTTVVHYHLARAPRRLAVLLVVGFVSIGVATYLLHRPRDPVVSFATRARVRLRTKARPGPASDAQYRALVDAWKTLALDKSDVDRDGKVEGAALERARATLATFYKTDEAYAFDLWLTKRHKKATLVVYFEARSGKPPIWLALDEAGARIHDAKRLPKGAFGAMKHAADAAE